MLSQQKTQPITQQTKYNLIDLLRNDFNAVFSLDYVSFIKIIQDCIPESLYLKGKANVSAEGINDGKSTKNVYGLTEDEEIRAFSGLLRFKEVINGTEADYKNFVACQIEMKKPVLTYDSFLQMRQYVLQSLTTPEDFSAAMWSILCNDLGKVHSVIEAYGRSSNPKNIGHDQLLAEMLKTQPDYFPGFMHLPQQHRHQIIEGYASGCDISMLEQLELPAVSLEALSKLDEPTLKLYILHTIFDVSGAAAHFKPNGSLTLHEETWTFFNALRESLEKIQHRPIEVTYAEYLKFRGECVGITNTSPESTALCRLAGMARLATHDQGKMLLTVWQNLPDSVRQTLTHELNVHGGKGLRAIFIGYGVAMLINPQSALQKEFNEAAKKLGIQVKPEQVMTANREGLRIGLLNLAAAFDNGRHLINTESNKGIFVVECDEIAKFLSREPRKSLDMNFELESKSDRRADFKLANHSLLKEIDTKQVSSNNMEQVKLNTNLANIMTLSKVANSTNNFFSKALIHLNEKVDVAANTNKNNPR